MELQTTGALAASKPAREESQFGLLRAMLLSLLVHAALLFGAAVVTALAGIAQTSPPAPEPQLRFTFAPLSEREPTESARGDVPFETPPASPPTPPPTPPPSPPAVQAQSSPTTAAVQPPSERRPSDDSGDLRDAAASDTDGSAVEGSGRSTDESAPPSDAVVDDSGRVRPSATARRSEGVGIQPGRSEPSIDLSGALRNYQQAIDAARAQQQPAPGGSSSNQTVYVPDLTNMPTRGAPFGVLEFSSRDYDWSDYSSQIYWAILRAWYQRLYVTTADFEKWGHSSGQWYLDHQSKINFHIERNGDVTRIVLRAPAGCPPLDQSALDALSEVILPPLPADFPRDEELVRATFIARGEVLNMRTMFRYLKSVNYF